MLPRRTVQTYNPKASFKTQNKAWYKIEMGEHRNNNNMSSYTITQEPTQKWTQKTTDQPPANKQSTERRQTF